MQVQIQILSIDKIENSKGGWDFWPILLNQNGQIIWQKTIGADSYDSPASFVTSPNNELLVALGSSSTVSGDKTTPFYGDHDTWIVELDITSLTNDNITTEEFNVYPNPFQDNITLSGENLENVEKIEITDALGKTIFSEDFSTEFNENTISISTEGIVNGSYILNVTTTEGVHSYKMLK